MKIVNFQKKMAIISFHLAQPSTKCQLEQENHGVLSLFVRGGFLLLKLL